jgi:hypothetical protein
VLEQTLGGEHMLDLTGADPERQRAKSSVRGGVTVAADDRFAGLRETELRPYHMHDAALKTLLSIHRNAKIPDVRLKCRDLFRGERILDRSDTRRNAVVNSRNRPLGTPQPESAAA